MHDHTLSASGEIFMAVAMALAVIAMLLVFLFAGRQTKSRPCEAHGERADARLPGLHPEALVRLAAAAGDAPGQLTEPGGHAIRPDEPIPPRDGPPPGRHEAA